MLFFILLCKPQISNNISNIKSFQEFMKLLLLKGPLFSCKEHTVPLGILDHLILISNWFTFSAHTIGCLKNLC